MKDRKENKTSQGFSLIELIIAMTILLVVFGLASTLFSRSLSTRQRESSRTDALTAAQAALNVISREISNSGYGLVNNGIVLTDSNSQKLHFLSNIKNNNNVLTDQRENITYYFEPDTKSILRYDAHGIINADLTTSPQTSIIINRISSVNFLYFNYSGSSSTPTTSSTPTLNTGRIRVTITVELEEVQGQVSNQSVKLTSDITLRNSNYMLQQY
jgi:prepilin-type N-terminal cleavage/methylation domain-containing protein